MASSQTVAALLLLAAAASARLVGPATRHGRSAFDTLRGGAGDVTLLIAHEEGETEATSPAALLDSLEEMIRYGEVRAPRRAARRKRRCSDAHL